MINLAELPKQLDDLVSGVALFLYRIVWTVLSVAVRPVSQSVARLRRRQSSISSTALLALAAFSAAAAAGWSTDLVKSLRLTGLTVAENRGGLLVLAGVALTIYVAGDALALCFAVIAERSRGRRRLWASMSRYMVATSIFLMLISLYELYRHFPSGGDERDPASPGGLVTFLVCAACILSWVPAGSGLAASLHRRWPRIRSGVRVALVCSALLGMASATLGVPAVLWAQSVFGDLAEPSPNVTVSKLYCATQPPHTVDVWMTLDNEGDAPASIGANAIAVTIGADDHKLFLSPVGAPILLVAEHKTVLVHMLGVSDKALPPDAGGLCEVMGLQDHLSFWKAAMRLPPNQHAVPEFK